MTAGKEHLANLEDRGIGDQQNALQRRTRSLGKGHSHDECSAQIRDQMLGVAAERGAGHGLGRQPGKCRERAGAANQNSNAKDEERSLDRSRNVCAHPYRLQCSRGGPPMIELWSTVATNRARSEMHAAGDGGPGHRCSRRPAAPARLVMYRLHAASPSSAMFLRRSPKPQNGRPRLDFPNHQGGAAFSDTLNASRCKKRGAILRHDAESAASRCNYSLQCDISPAKPLRCHSNISAILLRRNRVKGSGGVER